MATKAKPAAKKAASKTTTKPAAKKNAGKVTPKSSENEPVADGKQLVSYQEMLAQLGSKAQREAEREANTGNGGTPFINTEGKEFKIAADDGDEEFGDSIQCVVLATAFFNAYYDRPYVRGQSMVPACYAVAEDEDDLAPDDDVPVKQHDSCEGCPKNEWDTGANGSGKACGNRRKLAVLLLSDLEEGVVRPLLLSLPPTALKFWGRYVKAVARQHKLPPAGVVTRFDFDEENPQPCPIPTFEGIVGEDYMSLVFESVEAGEEIVMQKIDTSSYEPPSAAKKNSGAKFQRGAAAKKAAKKAPAKKAAGKR